MKHLLLALFLSGCGFTPFGDTIRSAVKDYGAQAYDEGLENSEFYICKVASIGSILRRYGRSKAEAWKALCRVEDGEGIVEDGATRLTP